MAVLGIISHELVPLCVFFGVLWHQFGAMRHRQFPFRQTDTCPERDAVQGMVVDWWRASRHAAAFLGGARDCGFRPRRKVSMMRICPPQSGHGSRSMRGVTSATGGSSCLAVCEPSKTRAFAILAFRPALASRP